MSVGYAEAGPASGPSAIPLHGWPYDIYSFVDVAPVLASAGYRVIIPYLRGYGTTRFLSGETVRNGQPSAIAVDTVALMDALNIQKAIIAGFDWGGRTADIMAALWPERCKGIVSVSGYLLGSQAVGKTPLPPKAELQWWYQFYFATDRGRDGYYKYRRDFCKLIWQLASPKWNFDDATFDRTAASFDNPDHIAIVIHNYRWRLGLAEGERSMTIWKSALPKRQSSAYPLSPWKAMPMAHRIRILALTPRNSRTSMRTGISREASGIICPRKLRKPLPRPSLMSTPSTGTRRNRNGGHGHELASIEFSFGASRTLRSRHRGICRTCFVFRGECTHEVSHHAYCPSGRQFDRRIPPPNTSC
jgi:pimeloyl-ACP methyl ester carboxylesterase